MNNLIKLEDIDKTTYKYEQQLLDSVTSLYYEYHNVRYIIIPNEEKGIFHINAKVDYVIVNKFNEENYMRFKIKGYSLQKEDMTIDFKLINFEINDEQQDLSKYEVEEIEKSTNDAYYDYKIKINTNLGKGRKVKVKLDYEYVVPIYDIKQSYKITYPCKRLQHEVYIKQDKISNDKWTVSASAFATFFNKQKRFDDKFKVEQTLENSLKILFDEWVLPGAGYVTVYSKNK